MPEAMELSERQLDQIREVVQENLAAWMERIPVRNALPTDPVLLERIVRVEDELKNQRELMQQGFHLMEKRFDQIDKRFEQVDKRIEDLRFDTAARFEQVGKRIEDLRSDTAARFEQVDKRFEQMRQDMNDRFLEMDSRFERADRRRTFWGVMTSVLITVVVAASTAITLVLG